MEVCHNDTWFKACLSSSAYDSASNYVTTTCIQLGFSAEGLCNCVLLLLSVFVLGANFLPQSDSMVEVNSGMNKTWLGCTTYERDGFRSCASRLNAQTYKSCERSEGLYAFGASCLRSMKAFFALLDSINYIANRCVANPSLY